MLVFGSVRPMFCWIGGGVLVAAAIVTTVLCVVLLPSHQPEPQRTAVRNLLDLSAAERRAYFASFDVVLSDCDGTVWGLLDAIPGASDGVAALQALPNKRLVFVSNNALRSDENYLAKFRQENISATMADVMHPGIAIVDHLQQTGFDGLIYAIGSTNLRRYLLAAGHRLVEAESRAQMDDTFSAIDRHAHDGLPVQAVVVDWDSNMEFKELLRAEGYLARDDCEFLVGATDVRLPFEKSTMGPGMVYPILEQATGRLATVLGKPGAGMRSVVMRKFAVQDPRRILFVGDT